MNKLFRLLASKVSTFAGSPSTFFIALMFVIIWASSGPLFNFSDTWQLAINTSTTIITFLMVFLLQNTQTRDAKAMQLKLDELIRSHRSARDAFVGLEVMTDEELRMLDKEFEQLKSVQAASPIMKQLHETILLEHERRKRVNPARSAANVAGRVVGNLVHQTKTDNSNQPVDESHHQSKH